MNENSGPLEVILPDDHLPPRRTCHEQHVQRRFGFAIIWADHDALTGGQSVVFEHWARRTAPT